MQPHSRPSVLSGALAPALLGLVFCAAAYGQAAPLETVSVRGEAERLLERAELEATLDDLDAAEGDFLDAIDLITAADGEFAPSLLDAYRGLARVLAARGEYLQAVTVLEQARHVSQRNFGLFNLDQVELLDELSAVFEQAGDTREAQETQREILQIAQRQFGADDVEVVPYHYRLAAYYELARMRTLARAQYERALEIIRDDPSSTSADALAPLIEIVRIDTILGEITRSDRQLIETLEAAPDAAAATRAQALAVLGDRELVDGELEAARRYYADAFASFTSPQDAREYFKSPRMLTMVPPPSAVDWNRRRNTEYAWGSITARFSLDANGKAQNITIVRADPPGLMDGLYAQRIAEAVFRPRIGDSGPIATGQLRYTHEFRYFLPEQD